MLRARQAGAAASPLAGTARWERCPPGPPEACDQPLDLARESPGEVAEWLKALAC
jgi:hypothetical protein